MTNKSIARITRIKGHRIFRDFVWGNLPPYDKRYNLIYGANGSGKTSLSTLFAYLERREAIPADVEFEFHDESKITSKDIPNMTLGPHVRVFNRDFISKSIGNVGDVEPIYVVGESNVALNAQLNDYRQKLKTIISNIENAQTAIQKANVKSDELAINKARDIKNQLSGSAPEHYQNYNKGNFLKTASKMNIQLTETYTLSDKDVETYHSIRRQRSKPYPSEIPKAISPHGVAEAYEGILEMLLDIPASHIIDELTSDTEVQSWVQKGLSLHSGERQTNDCHFCGNSINDKRLSDLRKHFSDEFAEFQRTIARTITRISNEKNSLVSDIPDAHRFYDDLIDKAKTAIAHVKNKQDAMRKLMDNLLQHLENKKENPFKPITPEDDGDCIQKAESDLQESLESLGKVLNEHKERNMNMREMILDSCQKLEKHYISAALSDFCQYGELIRSGNKDVEEYVQERRKLEGEINKIQQQIEDYITPAEELNEDLEEYLGHSEFRFVPHHNGYKITRGDEDEEASRLSEGEQTAIAFLYFLKSLKDKDTSLENTIVVIDDPVSNLDIDALFNAFAYMKKRTEECLQLFLLTHNLDMFKMVRGWFIHKWKNPNKRLIYSLHTTILKNKRRSTSIVQIDPLLNISDYHYSFGRVYSASKLCPQDAEVAHLWAMPNIARKLLETFLEYSFPHINPGDTTGALRRRLDKVNVDPAKKEKIVQVLHDLSHSQFPLSEFKRVATLKQLPEIMKSVLHIICVVNLNHYKGMVRVAQRKNKQIL